MNVVALAGGVGGARLADGLALALEPGRLIVIVNTGDDFDHLGLQICPDLDTVMYTLAGVANPVTGWGRAGETWQALEVLSTLGGPTWFRLGDQDLGLHLERTRRLRAGQSLSQVTAHFCRVMGIATKILPMSDDSVPTWVYTKEGEISFQEYFVRRQCHPEVTGFRFAGADQARPAPGVLASIQEADLVVICPSNPWVSIGPILSVPGILPALEREGLPVVAVSPIVGGQAIKGPAAKMYTELGITPSAAAVAQHYGSLLDGFVMDRQDAGLEPKVGADAGDSLRLKTWITDTIMKSRQDRERLAVEVLQFGHSLTVTS